MEELEIGLRVTDKGRMYISEYPSSYSPDFSAERHTYKSENDAKLSTLTEKIDSFKLKLQSK